MYRGKKNLPRIALTQDSKEWVKPKKNNVLWKEIVTKNYTNT